MCNRQSHFDVETCGMHIHELQSDAADAQNYPSMPTKIPRGSRTSFSSTCKHDDGGMSRVRQGGPSKRSETRQLTRLLHDMKRAGRRQCWSCRLAVPMSTAMKFWRCKAGCEVGCSQAHGAHVPDVAALPLCTSPGRSTMQCCWLMVWSMMTWSPLQVKSSARFLLTLLL